MSGEGFVEATWRGKRSFRCATDGLDLTVLMRGGKVVSLRQRAGAREWLAQPHRGDVTAAGYGSDFETAEMCGWDEMAPTITASTSLGQELPDHGEVWAVPWASDVVDGVLHQRVHGRRHPFVLSRTLTARSPHQVVMDYELTAAGRSPVPVLWAAHPQFAVEAGDRLRLEAEVTELVLSHGVGPVRPVAGQVLDGLARGQYRKRWLRLTGEHARAQIRSASGPQVTLSWRVDALPYLAIWEDAAAFCHVPVVALEPSNGWYDNLDAAVRAGRCVWPHPGVPVRWSVLLEVSG